MKRKEKRNILITAKLLDLRTGKTIVIHLHWRTDKDLSQFVLYDFVRKYLHKCGDRHKFSITYIGFAEQPKDTLAR